MNEHLSEKYVAGPKALPSILPYVVKECIAAYPTPADIEDVKSDKGNTTQFVEVMAKAFSARAYMRTNPSRASS